MTMVFSVKRSPARMAWWVMCNDKLVMTTDTKEEAITMARSFERRYGWPGV